MCIRDRFVATTMEDETSEFQLRNDGDTDEHVTLQPASTQPLLRASPARRVSTEPLTESKSTRVLPRLRPRGHRRNSPANDPPSTKLADDGGTPGEHELRGFVSWFLSFACGAMWLVWAFVPDPILDSMGATYRPSKYWALAIPAFISISVIYYVVACVSLSHAAAAPLWSKSTLTDEHSYPEVLPEEQAAAGPLPIPPHSDIPMAKVNMILGFR
eukprot:TRINITY_DN4012_c0_g1_i1.p1 TRINITY_DN4012_c0_g1~~TRINITY_DN4012_c0_g1_i1.p1  ORF type:complete len:215 (+),score=37.69 TRINITY_DN4012_c0_g1_i1:140-784(+)